MIKLLEMVTVDHESEPLKLESISCNMASWPFSFPPGFALIAPEGTELIIRKDGHFISISRRKRPTSASPK